MVTNVQGSAPTPEMSSVPKGEKKPASGSTEIHNMEDFKRVAPELYDATMLQMATDICNSAKKSVEKQKEIRLREEKNR